MCLFKNIYDSVFISFYQYKVKIHAHWPGACLAYSMDELLHLSYSKGWKYFSITKLQVHSYWRFGISK